MRIAAIRALIDTLEFSKENFEREVRLLLVRLYEDQLLTSDPGRAKLCYANHLRGHPESEH